MKIAEESKSGGDAGSRMGRIGNRPYWVLSLSIIIRAIHLMGAAVVLTSFLPGEGVQPPSPFYALVAFASGVGLFFTEWIRHRQICRELAGVSTFIKLILLGGAYILNRSSGANRIKGGSVQIN